MSGGTSAAPGAGVTGLVPSDFTLLDESARAFHLAEHLSRPVVLLFYRGDW